MRFGLWLVCYLGGLALLVPASWRLGVAMASASSDPLAMDRLIATAVTVNALLSAAVTAYAAPSLLAALQRAATRPGGSASVVPFGMSKQARSRQEHEARQWATRRRGLCCCGLSVLLIVSAMLTGGFSSLGAQFAIDVLSPAPTNGAGAWRGPRLRGAVDLALELLVVQIPRALVVSLPWLARFGRGRRGAQLRTPLVALIGMWLGATSGCIVRVQLLSQSQAMLQTSLLSQAFPLLPPHASPHTATAAAAAAAAAAAVQDQQMPTRQLYLT